ncbi:histone-like nucleoid-structuring protein Lsr2 [Streptomyces sp. NPDC058464]
MLDPRPEDEPVRLWARANGYLVNDRGRVPASVREAYEMSQR